MRLPLNALQLGLPTLLYSLIYSLKEVYYQVHHLVKPTTKCHTLIEQVTSKFIESCAQPKCYAITYVSLKKVIHK